jgi:hypothetical protein
MREFSWAVVDGGDRRRVGMRAPDELSALAGSVGGLRQARAALYVLHLLCNTCCVLVFKTREFNSSAIKHPGVHQLAQVVAILHPEPRILPPAACQHHPAASTLQQEGAKRAQRAAQKWHACPGRMVLHGYRGGSSCGCRAAATSMQLKPRGYGTSAREAKHSSQNLHRQRHRHPPAQINKAGTKTARGAT